MALELSSTLSNPAITMSIPDNCDWDEEEDDPINDEEYEYITDIVPFVAHFKKEMINRFPGSTCYFLGPQHFKELTLPSFEVCNSLLNPSVQRGSMARYFARVTFADGHKEYFLIKQVRSVENGKNEVKIGAAMHKIGKNNALVRSHTVPAVFGFEGSLLQDDTSPTVYFVVVPWLLNTVPLDSFIRNEKLLDLSLSTKDTLRMFAPILVMLISLWQEYKFAFLDAKLDQVIVDTSAQPPHLRLVDFGLSTIDGTVEGESVCVEATKISSSRSFLDCFCAFMDDFHSAMKVNTPNKNAALVKEWVSQKRRLRELKSTILQFRAWLQSVIV